MKAGLDLRTEWEKYHLSSDFCWVETTITCRDLAWYNRQRSNMDIVENLLFLPHLKKIIFGIRKGLSKNYVFVQPHFVFYDCTRFGLLCNQAIMDQAIGWATKASTINAIVKLRGHLLKKWTSGSVVIAPVPIQVPTTVRTSDIKKTLHMIVINMVASKLFWWLPRIGLANICAGFWVKTTRTITQIQISGIWCRTRTQWSNEKPISRPVISGAMMLTERREMTVINSTVCLSECGKRCWNFKK